MAARSGLWRGLLERAVRSPKLGVALFLAGLYVLLWPLVFTVFLHETEHTRFRLRLLLSVVWFLCALLIAAVTLLHELENLAERAGSLRRRRKRAARRRQLAALSSIAALLRPGATGLSDSFSFAAFIPDEKGTLTPVLEPSPQPWQHWAPGQGVVGIAWERPKSFVRARGEQTRDPALGLSTQQKRHYGQLTYVAGRTIFDEENRPVGVLSVSCKDDTDFDAAGGPERFKLLASDMGVLLGDAGPGD
jgi:hypothetical protein